MHFPVSVYIVFILLNQYIVQLPARVITMDCAVELGLGSVPFLRGLEWYMRRCVMHHCESTHLKFQTETLRR